MQTQFENALLIHNPNAGNGGDGRRRLIDQARRIFSSNGIEAELAETAGRRHRCRRSGYESTKRFRTAFACSRSLWRNHPLYPKR